MNNTVIITGDFKIRDNDWNVLYSYHSIYMDILHEIADNSNLELLLLINLVFIWYIDNIQDSDSVIDLMFLYVNLEKFNNHQILPNLRNQFNHVLLSVFIIIEEEFVSEKKQTIAKRKKNSSKSSKFK